MVWTNPELSPDGKNHAIRTGTSSEPGNSALLLSSWLQYISGRKRAPE